MLDLREDGSFSSDSKLTLRLVFGTTLMEDGVFSSGRRLT